MRQGQTTRHMILLCLLALWLGIAHSAPPKSTSTKIPNKTADVTHSLAEQLNNKHLTQADKRKLVDEAHRKLMIKLRFPSASACKSCHPRQYREWSVSQHAYAQLSPVFMAMQNTTNREQSGTTGDFCIRCHTPIGMTLHESVYASNLKRSPIAREGVTCITCHRQNKNYGKVSARVALVEGNLTDPIYGPRGNRVLKQVLANSNTYKVVTDVNQKGRKIHRKAIRFFALTTPKFCGSCHDVTLVNNFRLEEAFSEYRHSPAAKDATTCQGCHMGKKPGIKSGYRYGPAAKVGSVQTPKRKLSNHYFAGPDYPIIHPGLFPINAQAQTLATMAQWLRFNYKAGWGTDAFEDKVKATMTFPKPWDSPDARFDAREILNEQFALLKWARKQRQQILTAGYTLSPIHVQRASHRGIDFELTVHNGTNGHNVPTGFIAERLVFLQVTLTDKRGHVIYRSGDRDPNGDVRDLHSLYVHDHLLELDRDLFSLQSKFMIRNQRGGEREAVIPINRSFDPRPFVRPSTFSGILLGRPANGRIHRKGIPAKGHRQSHYHIPRRALHQHHGPYKLTVRLIAQMVPVNLIARIQAVGFDYGMSSTEIAKAVIKGAHVLATRTRWIHVD